jgi:ABC-2 type transport system ATP-binding protein
MAAAANPPLAAPGPARHIGAMQEAVIEVRGLTKRYGEVLAVDSIDFSVRRGTTTALLGGNGAGKTTTLAMLLGLLLPTSGSIAIFGVDMLRHRQKVLPRMNFSSPYVDLPGRLTVREILVVYGHLYGLEDTAARIASVAEDLSIVEFLDRQSRTLSAGQKTRIALAKALLNQPELLLLDEPTASLDPDTGDWVRSYLLDYQRRTGATLLLASHNMTEVERMCDHVMILRAGSIVEKGTPAGLIERFGRDTLEEVFLDVSRNRAGVEVSPIRAAQ